MSRGSLFWGIILLLFGSLLLLVNLGVLDVDVWGLFWPILLIVLGFWVLWGVIFGRNTRGEQAAVALDGAERASLQINHGAGRLSLGAGAGPGQLVEGEFGGGLSLEKHRVGDRMDAKLSVPVQFFPVFFWPGYNLNWSLVVNPEVPLHLELNTGAGEAHIDLSELQVHELRLQTGASSTRLVMPANAGSTHVAVEAGAALVNIRVPDGVAARIHVSSGLAGIDIDQKRFPRDGGLYRSPDYDTAANRVDLDIQTGVGSIEVS